MEIVIFSTFNRKKNTKKKKKKRVSLSIYLLLFTNAVIYNKCEHVKDNSQCFYFLKC